MASYKPAHKGVDENEAFIIVTARKEAYLSFREEAADSSKGFLSVPSHLGNFVAHLAILHGHAI